MTLWIQSFFLASFLIFLVSSINQAFSLTINSSSDQQNEPNARCVTKPPPSGSIIRRTYQMLRSIKNRLFHHQVAPLYSPLSVKDESSNNIVACPENEFNLYDPLDKTNRGTSKSDNVLHRLVKVELIKRLSKDQAIKGEKIACIDALFYKKLIQLLQAIQASEWRQMKDSRTFIADVIELFSYIHTHQAQWTKTAVQDKMSLEVEVMIPKKQLNPVLSKMKQQFKDKQSNSVFKDHQKVRLLVRPNGAMTIMYRGTGEVISNDFIKGEGFYGISLQPEMNVSRRVLLFPKNQKGGTELKKQMIIYDKIEKYKSNLPSQSKSIGLAEASLVSYEEENLVSKKNKILAAVDTELYDSNLQEDKSKLLKKTVNINKNKLKIFRSIANGLFNFHQIVLVHSDLKPENILYKKNGDEVVIANYSLAFDPKQDEQTVGTIDYLSPEFCTKYLPPKICTQKEWNTTDPIEQAQKADIYSYGIMAFNITNPFSVLSGPIKRCWKAPVKLKDHQCFVELEANRIHKKAEDLIPQRCSIQLKKNVQPDCFERVVADCLNPDPKKRPTAFELKKRLENIESTAH